MRGVTLALLLCGVTAGAPSDLSGPLLRPSLPLVVRADQANRWQEGTTEVWHLRGNCALAQGSTTARAWEAVLWVRRADPLGGDPSKVLAYLEGDVAVDYAHDGPPHSQTGLRAQSIRDQRWLGRFQTTTELEIRAPVTGFEPRVKPGIVQRGVQAREAEASGVQLAQFSTTLPGYLPAPPAGPNAVPSPALRSPPRIWPWPSSHDPAGPRPGTGAAPPPSAPIASPGTQPTARRIILRSRSNVRMQGDAFRSPDGQETIAVLTSGVNLIVDGIENLRGLTGDKVDIEADSVVLWTARLDAFDLGGQNAVERLQPKDAPLEFYLEGNIVFREGERVIYADRMYYNVRGRYGIVLNAEVLTPAPGYQGLVRLKADVLQQLNESQFQAFGAAVTTSRLGVPRYWLQAEQVQFRDTQTEPHDLFTGQIPVDPETGEPAVEHHYSVSSRNNFLFLGGVPVLYWPLMATRLEQPSFYIDRIRVGHDGIFGYHVAARLDLYQLLGLRDPPDGTKWSVTPSYFSQRGFGLGTEFLYDRYGVFDIPGPVRGKFDAWGIADDGLDNLGLDRRAVPLEDDLRGRVLWQHRHYLPNDYQFTGEVGFISDRNFLEQYYEREWDTAKDQTTGLELKKFSANSTWALSADVRLNDFFTQTEWLPRFDHFLLGQSLFEQFTWYAHTNVGYAQLRTADPASTVAPELPQHPLPWETDPTTGLRYGDRSGLRAATRYEVDLPFALGPVKITPYAVGEAAYWQEDRGAAEVARLYGQAGVRTSLPFWRADPSVQSELLNLNGLAHKVSLDANIFWADASRNLDQFPLYDPLDDDATEHFRRRLPLPALRFDERYYALRSGMQGWVTAPSTEIADDLAVGQLGIHQRWQTKRGAPGREHLVDWIALDVDGSLFPNAADNFGQTLGLLNYDFRWHVGDRLTLLSDGFMDFFEQGLRTFSLGGRLSRPAHGSVYLGLRSIEGPIHSNLLSTNVNYRMSEKWILNAAASVDLSDVGNIGESLSVIRIGESFLIHAGVNVDHSRGSVGAVFSVEPRFLAGRLGRVGGIPVPPAGALGLE